MADGRSRLGRSNVNETTLYLWPVSWCYRCSGRCSVPLADVERRDGSCSHAWLDHQFLYLRDLAQPAPDRRRQSVNSGAFDGSLGPSLWDRDRNIGLRRSRVPRKNRRASCRLWPDCSGELRLRGPEVPYGRIVKDPYGEAALIWLFGMMS